MALPPNWRLQLSGLSVTPAACATGAPDWRPQLKRVSLACVRDTRRITDYGRADTKDASHRSCACLVD